MPKERETFGLREFSGRIEDILSEKQREVAHIILSTLYKGNNNIRWPILKRKPLNKFLVERLDETIECLHGYGILLFRKER
ncbi:hypothetical protein [Fictibacillus gelatini]|uniref:hypothetical protein n=1 Tax=Fictibacillus gelatini TaxID=225985 RepID=UPI0004012DEE|nr:hypothetical protein [Fictibacillus gelatini]